MTAPSAPPLILPGDPDAIQVLRTIRSLLVQAERFSVAEDALARMSTILVAQTAIETLFRCAWERLTSKSKDNPQMVDIENDLFGALKSHGLKDREKVKALRSCRNSVAHHGSIPSTEDAQRYGTNARAFASHFVAVAWGEDLERLTGVALIKDEFWRRHLERAYSLLDDSDFVLEDDTGHSFGAIDEDSRSAIAAGLAQEMWSFCNGRILWALTRKAKPLFSRLDYGNHHDRELQENYLEREHALKTELLALHFGVRQSDLDRFLHVESASVMFNTYGKMQISITNRPTSEDARFAVEFAADWILRAQQHVR